MHPLSDKDLDRLSREAAEQFDVEQNTSGWEKLEQKLNKHLPVMGKKERRRFIFLIWLFALLSGGALTWMLTENNNPELHITKKSNEFNSPISKADQSDRIGKTKNHLPSTTANNNANAKNGNTSLPQTIDRHGTANEATSHLHERQSRNVDRLRLNEKKKPYSSVPVLNDSQEKTNSKLATVPSTDIYNNQRRSAISSLNQSDLPPKDDITKSSVDTTIKKESEKPNVSDVTKMLSDSSAVARKNSSSIKKPAFRKGLEIGLVAAPDMSNVKFKNTDKAGFNFGLQVGYRFSQRLSLNTGVLYTRKNYTSLGKDFNAPKGTWLDNVMLDKVQGNCYMFDVPINIRYDLNTNNDHRYFVSAGLSSYFMKEENYDYYYRYPNGASSHRFRSYPSSKGHVFSILNISAGYEKNIRKNLSVQAEPYFKIPLSGVGYGNIRLNSYGVFFSLKYKPGQGTGKK